MRQDSQDISDVLNANTDSMLKSHTIQQTKRESVALNAETLTPREFVENH